MEKMNTHLDRAFKYLTLGCLLSLSAGLLTSISVLALSHVFIALPGLYFLGKINYKKVEKSSWALVGMIVAIIASVLFGQDVAINGYKPLFKVKYFVFGFLMIAPFSVAFSKHFKQKEIKWLLYTFCVASTVASIFGMLAMKTGFNYLTWREVSPFRNSGLFGMGMNYAQNLTYFLIIILGLIFYQKKTKEFINTNFLYAVFLINFIGLYFTYTRGALLALLIGIPFYFFKKNKTWFVAAVISFLLFGASLYFVSGKSFIRPTSDSERVSLWQAASKAYQERPVLGYGFLNFEHHARDIKKRYNLAEPQYGGHAHNNFLEILASTGTLGGLSFTLWLVFWFIEMYRRNDVVANITLPFIVVFFVSGLTQATITLGINLFFIMAVYSLSQSKVVEPSC